MLAEVVGEDGRDLAVEEVETLFKVVGMGILVGERHGNIQVLADAALRHSKKKTAAAFSALANKWNTTIRFITFNAPELLAGKSTQVTIRVPQEMRINHKLGDRGFINGTRQHSDVKLSINFLLHRFKEDIPGLSYGTRNIRGVMRKTDAVEWVRVEERTHNRDVDFRRVNTQPSLTVKIQWKTTADLDLMGFIVDLPRIQ